MLFAKTMGLRKYRMYLSNLTLLVWEAQLGSRPKFPTWPFRPDHRQLHGLCLVGLMGKAAPRLDLVHRLCIRVFRRELQLRTGNPLASHDRAQICIPTIGSSIKKRLYQGNWQRYFSDIFMKTFYVGDLDKDPFLQSGSALDHSWPFPLFCPKPLRPIKRQGLLFGAPWLLDSTPSALMYLTLSLLFYVEKWTMGSWHLLLPLVTLIP